MKQDDEAITRLIRYGGVLGTFLVTGAVILGVDFEAQVLIPLLSLYGGMMGLHSLAQLDRRRRSDDSFDAQDRDDDRPPRRRKNDDADA